MIILDTNVLSELMKARPDTNVSTWVAGKPAVSLFTTTITEAEILYGLALLPAGQRRTGLEQAARALFAEDLGTRIIPFDSTAASEFAALASYRRQLGRPISMADGQIAAIARSRGASLATRDTGDFENCGIDIVDPWNAAVH